MALSKEDLDKIKLPLSDEDYQMLRREDARTCYKIWQLASPELREAFNKKEAERNYNNNTKGGLRKTTGIILDVYGKLENLFLDESDDD